MKRKSSGEVVVAVLVGVVVAVTLYIASFAKSHHAEVSPASHDAVATQEQAASDAAFVAAPLQATSGTDATTAAR